VSAFQDILDEDDDVTETPELADTSTATAGDEPETVAAVAETPAPVETETSAPASDAVEAQPITREDGAIWSENAKRWYLNGKIVAGEAPTVTPSEPSIPKAETPTAPVVEAPPAPIGEPWQVRGAGQKHVIPGAFVTPEGKVVIEAEQSQRVRDLIAAGIQHNQNYGREKQEWTQRIQQAEAAGDLKASKYNKASVYLFDKLQSVLAEHPQELDLIRRELAIELRSADLEIPRAQAQSSEPQPEQVEQQFAQTLTGYLDELIDDAPRGILSAEDVADLRQTFARRMAAYAAEHEGAIALDTHAVKADFEREIKMAQRAQQQSAKAAADAQKAKAAAAFNAANTPVKPVSAPAKPAANRVPVTTASAKKAPSWDQRVNDIWKDTDDDE
jgi:hypothetical protein